MWLKQRRESNCAGITFAKNNYLSIHTLRALADLKHQLLGLLVSIGFVNANLPPRQQRGVDSVLSITGREINMNNKNYKLLEGLLCAALYPNIAILHQSGHTSTNSDLMSITQRSKRNQILFATRQNEIVHIHPSSVNSNVSYFSSPYLIYHEKIKTSKVFISDVSMISPLSLILFSSHELRIMQNEKEHILFLDSGWIRFPIPSYTVRSRLLLQLIFISDSILMSCVFSWAYSCND
jgi:hypothetical protein